MIKYILVAMLVAAPAVAQTPPASQVSQFAASLSQALATALAENESLRGQVGELSKQNAELKAPKPAPAPAAAPEPAAPPPTKGR